MPWMIPAVAATLFDTLVLVFVYFYLFSQYRERSVGLWPLSWPLYTLRLLMPKPLSTATWTAWIYLTMLRYRFGRKVFSWEN